MKAKRKDMPRAIMEGVAHRGLHDALAPENSLRAFNNAIANGLAYEFDVHLSKDGRFVVIHDSDLRRMTKEEGFIEELTFEEIRKHRLPDGSPIPSLEEVIALNHGEVPMVVEIKVPEEIKGRGAWARKIGKVLRHYLDSNITHRENVMVISFDPRALWAFGKGYVRGLLVTTKVKSILMLKGFFETLDVELPLIEEKSVQKYRKRGGILNCYTIENLEQLEKYKDLVDTLTYENIDPMSVKKALLVK